MRMFQRKGITSLLIVCIATLLTIAIGSKVKAAVAWQHLWSYPVFRVDTSFAGTLTGYVVNAGNNYSNDTDLTMTGSLGALYEAIWRNDQGWVRTVPVDSNGTILWDSAPSTWSGPVGISGMPGSGNVQTSTNYRVGDTLVQSHWRGNQGWYRYVPIVNDAVQWTSAPTWSGPVNISSMPGTGDMQAAGDYAVVNTLIQAFWRGNQGWSRNVPIVSGVVQWGQASAWSGPINLSTMPGSGDMQAQDNYSIGNTYWQITWRNNVQWTRHVPIVNGVVQFGQASSWVETTYQEDLPGSGTVQTQGSYLLGWTGSGTDLIPPHGEIQVEYQDLQYPFQAYALPLNAAGQQCYVFPLPTPTGNCSTTEKAVSARIFVNRALLVNNPDYIVRHEMGHVFGLYHPPCTDPASVMKEPSCGPNPPTILQPDDIQWLNLHY